MTEPLNLSQPHRHTARSRIRRIGIGVFVGLFCVWGFGQLARDATLLTALCFYFPSVVVAALMMAMAFGLAVSRRWWSALIFSLMLIPPVAVVVFVENTFVPRGTGSSSQLRLVHWNTKGRPARSGVAEFLLSEQADLYVLTDMAGEAHVGVLRDQLGSAYVAETFGNLAVVGKGELKAEGWLFDHDEFKVQAVTWTPVDRPISLLVVDLPSDVWVARGPLLQKVNDLIKRRYPDLVVGDFNAPRRSWELANLPDGYRHAYDSVGSGWGYTWPVPAPVYAIDQCIYGPRVMPANYRLGGLSGDSDHRYQVFDFAIDRR